MLYAVIAVIAALLLFLLISYILTSKNYSFKIDNYEIKVQTRGAHLKIFVNEQMIEDYYMPQLIKGEEYKIQIGEKEVVLKCKSSSLGYKMRVELIVEGNTVADNGVVLKGKKDPEQNSSIDDAINNIHKEATGEKVIKAPEVKEENPSDENK